MVKRISRRFVSLLLTFVTILTLLPAMTLPALAASGNVTGLANENIGLSFNGDAEVAWSASGDQITGSAISKGGTCGNTSYKSTLTITNKRSTKATLSFDYAIEQNSGEIKVDGSSVTTGGNVSKELAYNESIKVYIKSGSTSAATKITITKIKLVSAATATVTFQPAVNGSYTVDENTITGTYSNTQSSTIPYRVEATPAGGYQFMGWSDVTHGKYISTAAATELNIESDCTITARFASKTAALFETKGQRFADLNEAVAYAQANGQSKVTLAADGSISDTYTIPAGITLLIPFDEAGTLYKATPTATHETTPPAAKPFRTLTMAANSSITLASGAAISVGGQYYAGGGGQSGKMGGPYGCIRMESGSAITVQDGASLYAWGFISGSGAVTVQSGGSVYEWYQIADFRGGTASSAMGNEVFPFSQYFVQNIEVPLTLNAGANEQVYSGVYASNTTYTTAINFIGDTGMFKVESGSFTKDYDEKTDRLVFTVNGEAALNTLSLKLAGMSVNSASYVLPITNNITINIQSGNVTINQDAALLAGVEVNIAEGAGLTVSNGKNIYFYDSDEWNSDNFVMGSCKFKSVAYAPGKAYNRSNNDLVDAKMDVNGSVTAIGAIYTTKGGADICSSKGTGKYIQQGAPGTDSETYQYTQIKSNVTAHDIPITPAKLLNKANGSYTETAGSEANVTFTYCACPTCGGKWTPDLKVAAIIDGNGVQADTYATLQAAVTNYQPDSSTAPKNYIQMLHNSAENITADRNLYLDLNGRTVTGKFDMAGYTLCGMDSSVKGYDVLPKGKIVGAVSGYAKEMIYQTPTVQGNEGDDAYKRYVAILGKENDTPTLSFHRFNISVTGYRFELATGNKPKCALFFIGKFQGDDVAKGYLASLGFTLTDENDAPLGTDSYSIPSDPKEIPDRPDDGVEIDSKVVRDVVDGAYLFEAYLMRDIDTEDPATYQTPFGATAQATFKNNGTQQSDPQKLSFQEAWQKAEDLTEDQKAILNGKFPGEPGINQ